MRPIDLSDPAATEVLGGLLAARGLPVTPDDMRAVQDTYADVREKLAALRSVPLSYVEPRIEPLSSLQWIVDGQHDQLLGRSSAQAPSSWPGESPPSADDSLTDLTAGQLMACYAAGEVSPVEVVTAYIARIEESDSQIDAVISVLAERALAQARRSQTRWRDGEALALDGVPFGVKDIIETAGVRTTGGSKLYADFVPQITASSVQRLEDAGAVLLAKLQTYEFASSQRLNGNGHNPWDPSRTPGGSSEGSAAAVAARFMPLAVGTDTGGSIRVPAAFCGVVGMKPTYGRIPRHGVMPLAWSIDHVGPITRSVEDAARALAVMAGHDHRDPTSSTAPVPDYSAHLDSGVEGLRIGVPSTWFFEGCDPQVVAATETAIQRLLELGAVLVDVKVPSADQSEIVSWVIQMAERSAAHDGHLDQMHDFAPLNAIGLAASHLVPASDYLRALRVRRLLQDELSAVFRSTDVLITPGPVCVAPRLEDFRAEIGSESIPWLKVVTRNTRIFSMLGVPALAVPVGLDNRGLPIGMQVVGPPHADALCLRVGRAYQQVTDWHSLRPPFPRTAS